MTTRPRVEDVLRELAPHVLGALLRRYGGFEDCEDATQEALLAAAVQWQAHGVPRNPKGWLITTASRRRIELSRGQAARGRREDAFAQAERHRQYSATADDSLTLMLMCCHPALTRGSQVALTLRAVGGLTTAEIARALLVPEAAVAQRISRAKQRIKASGLRFELPPPAEMGDRIAAVLHVLYLVFTEGHTASSGPELYRVDLTTEAIRLTRQLHRQRPRDGEIAGLLALMLLTDARRHARTRPAGSLIPLAEQDRSRWDPAAIAEGTALISATMAIAPIGPYQLQAAIAAVHDEATRAEDTDWKQILGLYTLLRNIAPGPMVTLNRIVAAAMVHGPQTALHELAAAETGPALAQHEPIHYRIHAVRAHLLALTGDHATAREHYRLAAQGALNLPERRYLESRAAQP